jgi:hypothetical protein
LGKVLSNLKESCIETWVSWRKMKAARFEVASLLRWADLVGSKAPAIFHEIAVKKKVGGGACRFEIDSKGGNWGREAFIWGSEKGKEKCLRSGCD